MLKAIIVLVLAVALVAAQDYKAWTAKERAECREEREELCRKSQANYKTKVSLRVTAQTNLRQADLTLQKAKASVVVATKLVNERKHELAMALGAESQAKKYTTWVCVDKMRSSAYEQFLESRKKTVIKKHHLPPVVRKPPVNAQKEDQICANQAGPAYCNGWRNCMRSKGFAMGANWCQFPTGKLPNTPGWFEDDTQCRQQYIVPYCNSWRACMIKAGVKGIKPNSCFLDTKLDA